jgi:hypothetical protein
MTKNMKTKLPNPENREKMPLQPVNFYLLIGAVALIIVGFLLMAGGRSENPEVFNYGMFSFRRITLAPVVVVAGFVLAGYGIMKRPRE